MLLGIVVEVSAEVGDRPGAVGHRMSGVAQLVGGHDPGGVRCAATAGARGLHAREDALGDDVALHLGERRLDLQEGVSRGRGGVNRRVEGPESEVAGVEAVDRGDDIRGVPPEDALDVARAEVVEVGGEPGAVGIRPGCAVLEDAVAASPVESVALAVGQLAPFDGCQSSRVASPDICP